jgi:hypothetical protein
VQFIHTLASNSLRRREGEYATKLMDFRWQYQFTLDKFFFLDEFPDDIDRYEEISYEECMDASLVLGHEDSAAWPGHGPQRD